MKEDFADFVEDFADFVYKLRAVLLEHGIDAVVSS
jgi:hypothetical protein